MSKGLKLSDQFLIAENQVEEIERFRDGAPGWWTATATSGTVAAVAKRGGGISLTTQAADNAVATLVSDVKEFIVAAGKPLSIGFRVLFTEAATNVANLLIGLHSGTAASALANDGAGTPSSYSGFSFYKVDGQTNWSVQSSVGTTKVTTTLDAAGSLNKTAQVAGGSSYQLLEIDVIPKTSTLCDVIYKINGITVAKHTDFVYTSIAAMAALVCLKAGSSSAEAVEVGMCRYGYLI